MRHQKETDSRHCFSRRRLPFALVAMAGFAFLSTADPTPAGAQAQTALSGSTGSSSAGTAVASNVQAGRSAVSIPNFRPSRYGPGGRSRFAEGTGYFRPYTLSPRPVYRTEIGAQPIRRTTFSLGYVSYAGYGSYYY